MPATNIATDPMFFVTVCADNEAACEWFLQASESDLNMTFEAARDLANDLDAAIVLRDAEGFQKGRIEANGEYRMTTTQTPTTKPVRIQTVSADVSDRVASRMLDTEPPHMGYFAYTGETYRKVYGVSAEESVIDATLAAAKKRLSVLREGFRLGAADFAANLKR